LDKHTIALSLDSFRRTGLSKFIPVHNIVNKKLRAVFTSLSKHVQHNVHNAHEE